MNINFTGIQQVMSQMGGQQLLGTESNLLPGRGGEISLFGRRLTEILGNMEHPDLEQTPFGAMVQNQENSIEAVLARLGADANGLNLELSGLEPAQGLHLLTGGLDLSKIGQRLENHSLDMETLSRNLSLGDGKSVSNEPGAAFLSQFKVLTAALDSSSHGKAKLRPQGVDALEEVLAAAGFDPQAVTGLCEDLKEKMEDQGALPVSQVADALMELAESFGEETEDVVVESSVLPYMVSIFEAVGLPHDTVNKVVAASERGGRGISLDVIIQELQTLSETPGTNDLPGISSNQGSFLALMEQLNLPVSQGETVSLTTVRDALVQWKQSLGAQAAMSEAPRTHVPSVLATLVQGGETSDASNDAQALMERLFQQITLPEKTGMAAPAHMEAGLKPQLKLDTVDFQKNAAAFVKAMETLAPEEAVKEMPAFKEVVALLSGNREQHSLQAALHREAQPRGQERQTRTGESAVSLSEPRAEQPISVETPKERPAPKPLPQYVTQQVGKGLARAVNQGESSLTLQLKPVSLGRLIMTIDNLGSSMKVSIMTEHHAAKDILTSHANELRTVMANAGISLDQFDVDMSQDFRQSLADAHTPSGGSRQDKKNSDQGQFSLSGSQDVNDVTASPARAVAQDGGYHFVA